MPSENEESGSFYENLKKDGNELLKTVKRYPLITVCFLIAVIFLIGIPYGQVYLQGINNNTVEATLENQYRATLAQIFGGVAIAIGLYYTWRRIGIAEKDLQATQENLKVAQDSLKVTQDNLEATQKVAQDNLKVAQEGQINERFTRAVDQLGNDKIEIRLGGIYALERISQESEKDYWPIVEILTDYVRKNSPTKREFKGSDQAINPISMDIQANESKVIEIQEKKGVSLDVQAVLTVIKRRKCFFQNGESTILNLQRTNLRMADLEKAHLEAANLHRADLEKAILTEANLKCAILWESHLEKAILTKANLEGAILWESHLEGADLQGANLLGAFFDGANLEGAKLGGANLKVAIKLTIDQLSKVNTLYKATIDDELLIPLKEKYPDLFKRPEYFLEYF